jgi:hypothetical protein
MRQAFDAAWAVIRKQELRVPLNETLVGVAAEGISDAEQLQRGTATHAPHTTSWAAFRRYANPCLAISRLATRF